MSDDKILDCKADEEEFESLLLAVLDGQLKSAEKKRGRPRKGVTRDCHLDVRLTTWEKERLDQAAADSGMKAADWAREVLLTAADKRQAGLSEDIRRLSQQIKQLGRGAVAEPHSKPSR